MATTNVASVGRVPSLRRAQRITSYVPMALVLLTIALVVAVLMAVPTQLVVVSVVALSVLVLVASRPVFAAYVLLCLGPLLSGIDRGAAVPFLRPTEALAALVGLGLLARGILVVLASGLPRLRLTTMDAAVVVLAIASSVAPLLWMLARGVEVGSDDITYGLLVWKFAAIYLIFRTCVKTERQVRTGLWIAMLVGAVVSVIAIAQSLGVEPVVAFVRDHFAPYGNTEAVANNRGGATLGLPIAAADLLIYDLAIAVGFLIRSSTLVPHTLRRFALVVLMVLFAAGVIASGEFSALIGLVIAIIVLSVIARRGAVILYLLPALCIGLLVLWPVIERRLMGFQSTTGLPVSWTGRLYNLRSYFWPELFSHDRFILGVRLAARVIVPTQATGYVWIESGYTWLLWSGGIPFLLAFLWFAYVGIRRGVVVARSRADAVGVAGLAGAAGLSVVAVLMVIDPHLTYRGAADLLFALLALATIERTRRPGKQRVRSTTST